MDVREIAPSPSVVAALRVFIVAGELLCVAGQWMLFPLSAAVVEVAPETMPALWPYRVAGLLGILCVEIALAALFSLLAMVERRDVFSERAVHWVDLIIGCAVMEGVLAFGVLAVGLFWSPRAVDPVTGVEFGASLMMPAVALGLVAVAALAAAFVMLMLVMRSLLVQATAQRRELDAVI